jgi:hypothetical protein
MLLLGVLVAATAARSAASPAPLPAAPSRAAAAAAAAAGGGKVVFGVTLHGLTVLSFNDTARTALRGALVQRAGAGALSSDVALGQARGTVVSGGDAAASAAGVVHEARLVFSAVSIATPSLERATAVRNRIDATTTDALLSSFQDQLDLQGFAGLFPHLSISKTAAVASASRPKRCGAHFERVSCAGTDFCEAASGHCERELDKRLALERFCGNSYKFAGTRRELDAGSAAQSSLPPLLPWGKEAAGLRVRPALMGVVMLVGMSQLGRESAAAASYDADNWDAGADWSQLSAAVGKLDGAQSRLTQLTDLTSDVPMPNVDFCHFIDHSVHQNVQTAARELDALASLAYGTYAQHPTMSVLMRQHAVCDNAVRHLLCLSAFPMHSCAHARACSMACENANICAEEAAMNANASASAASAFCSSCDLYCAKTCVEQAAPPLDDPLWMHAYIPHMIGGGILVLLMCAGMCCWKLRSAGTRGLRQLHEHADFSKQHAQVLAEALKVNTGTLATNIRGGGDGGGSASSSSPHSRGRSDSSASPFARGRSDSLSAIALRKMAPRGRGASYGEDVKADLTSAALRAFTPKGRGDSFGEEVKSQGMVAAAAAAAQSSGGKSTGVRKLSQVVLEEALASGALQQAASALESSMSDRSDTSSTHGGTPHSSSSSTRSTESRGGARGVLRAALERASNDEPPLPAYVARMRNQAARAFWAEWSPSTASVPWAAFLDHFEAQFLAEHESMTRVQAAHLRRLVTSEEGGGIVTTTSFDRFAQSVELSASWDPSTALAPGGANGGGSSSAAAEPRPALSPLHRPQQLRSPIPAASPRMRSPHPMSSDLGSSPVVKTSARVPALAASRRDEIAARARARAREHAQTLSPAPAVASPRERQLRAAPVVQRSEV